MVKDKEHVESKVCAQFISCIGLLKFCNRWVVAKQKYPYACKKSF